FFLTGRARPSGPVLAPTREPTHPRGCDVPLFLAKRDSVAHDGPVRHPCEAEEPPIPSGAGARRREEPLSAPGLRPPRAPCRLSPVTFIVGAPAPADWVVTGSPDFKDHELFGVPFQAAAVQPVAGDPTTLARLTFADSVTIPSNRHGSNQGNSFAGRAQLQKP